MGRILTTAISGRTSAGPDLRGEAMTEILRVQPGTAPAEAVARAAAILDAGGVVALPTDTVYGLAARGAFPTALDRIYELKGRPAQKALPYLLGDADELDRYVAAPARFERRHAEVLWPGAVTLVVGPEGRTVALRVPDHPFARAALRAAGGPVAATSANRSGRPAACDAAGVLADLPTGIDLVVDAGPTPVGRESTLLRVAPDGRRRVLRAGAVTEAEIRRRVPVRILLVCTGNTCRSPMAAALLRDALLKKLGVASGRAEEAGFVVDSAGLDAYGATPMTFEAEEALRRLGTPAPPHASRRLGRGDVDAADHLWVMTTDHARRLAAQFPEAAPRIALFDPSGRDTPDPFGGDARTYLRTAEHLASAAAARAAALLADA